MANQVIVILLSLAIYDLLKHLMACVAWAFEAVQELDRWHK